ncbi:hypothetical protein MKZ38_001861 [Zalerion maritima]|uniref:Rhodanese domain-containing protein n=1 Tax=Zalerion maritima TaxID=339359 RepID=A0AAD5RR87_9PEZI|nr:hypothetical protein MKZ38_001861 [Zalerion maritima]
MMGLRTIITSLLASSLLAPALAAPTPAQAIEKRASSYWVANVDRLGQAAFNDAPDSYKIFRNVVDDYGADSTGATDSTDAINLAISDGGRCGQGCDSTTTSPAIVYFPPGTYRVSAPLVQYYYTQMIGDATDPPTLLADSSFEGMAVIDADPYNDDGSNWFTNQNNFFRQVRNFVIDLTEMPASRGAGIHWQVAQATSLQNIRFEMSTDADTVQLGIFMDNGSGGFMTDLVFNGGQYGAFFGSQQFTTRNLTFNNCQTAIFMNWNWLWTIQDISVNNCGVGVDMSNGGPTNQAVGSVIVLDSTFTGTPVGIRTAYQTSSAETNGTLIVENCDFSGSDVAIQFAASESDTSTLLAGGSTVDFYSQGRVYNDVQSASTQQGSGSSVSRPTALVGDGNKFFTKSRPQYEGYDASQFVHVKSNDFANAAGDGSTDDTAAIQSILDGVADSGTDQVVYFDHGAYVITDTITVPNNIKITGEMLPLILAGGDSSFKDMNSPKPVFKVGSAGDTGAVEMSDLMFETQGAQGGAILMQWNLGQTSAGSNGLWDVHFRVGGSAGTQLQSDTCSKNPDVETTDDTMTACTGSFMHLHITEQAAVYLENVWSWTSDHELDIRDHNQINIFNGRGILVESQEGPVWMWGTASEHNVLFNYQISNARNVFMGAIQTETPYYQGNPNSLTPFTVQSAFSDPDFSTSCASGGDGCTRSWGLRVTDSSDVFLYGGGLYSFFDNYSQDCLDTESCQENMVSFETSTVHTYGLSTKASTSMLTVNGQSAASDSDNRNNFCATLASFHSQPN